MARYLRHRRVAKIITLFLYGAVAAGVAAGVFLVLRHGLGYLAKDSFFRIAFPFYLNELFLLVTMYFVFVSAAIVSIFLFFRRDDSWIIASPRFSFLPLYDAIKVFLSSLWPLLLIGLPGLAAIRSVSGLSFLGILISCFGLIILAALTVGAAIVLVFLLAVILSKISLRTRTSRRSLLTIPYLSFFTALAIGAFSIAVWYRVTHVDLIELFQINDLASLTSRIDAVSEQFHFFPSHLAALTIFLVAGGNIYAGLVAVGKLLALLVTIAAIFFLLLPHYLSLWQQLQEGRFEARGGGKKSVLVPPRAFPRWLKGIYGVLLEKEILVMFRNTRNLLWFGFMSLLMFLQVGLMTFSYATTDRIATPAPSATGLIQALQLLTIGYFISAFVLRYAFPAFSTERRTAWILAAAPVDFGRLFYAKLLFYGALFIFIGFGVGIMQTAIVPASSALLFIFFLAGVIVTVTALGVSLGALFPNFQTDDPETLSTSLPGLACIGLSLVVVSFGALLWYRFSTGRPGGELFLYGILSLAAVGIVARRAAFSLRRLEFVKKL
ncbi:MAG: hypothetical protein Q8Q94_04345 [bacterium]|nr:hypothetical protein [bacterium]MDZ4299790.1 hypothetical protein [Candidatus Sungbacteria bacterium]